MNPADLSSLEANVRTLRIIAAALIAGVVTFAVVAVGVLGPQPANRPADPNALPVVTLVAGFVLLSNAGMALLLPRQLAEGQLRQLTKTPRTDESADETPRLFGIIQTMHIIRLALLEGAAFLGLIAYLVEGRPAALAVPGVCLVLMLVNFPTLSGVANGVEALRLRLDEIRRSMA